MQIKTDKTITLDGDEARATLTIVVSDCEKCIDQFEADFDQWMRDRKRSGKDRPCGCREESSS